MFSTAPSTGTRRRAARGGVAALALAATGLLAAGTAAATTVPADDTTDTATAVEPGTWPRTVVHELGETVIEEQPQRIVATSITITGTLLAIDAPVVASAATGVRAGFTDDNGFFIQWADVAAERGVEVLYPDLEFDLEAVIAADPDLIVISTTGADTTAEGYDILSEIAPTVAYNYGSQSWQDLAVELGIATGLEAEAQAAIDDFDAYVADAAAAITLPDPATASLVVYNGPENDSAVAKVGSAHGLVFTALGFDVVDADAELDTSQQVRQDFAFVSYENLSRAVGGDTVFIVNGDDDTAADFLAADVLANLTAVQNEAVHALGIHSFRVDNYSARDIVDTVVSIFG